MATEKHRSTFNFRIAAAYRCFVVPALVNRQVCRLSSSEPAFQDFLPQRASASTSIKWYPLIFFSPGWQRKRLVVPTATCNECTVQAIATDGSLQTLLDKDRLSTAEPEQDDADAEKWREQYEVRKD